MWIKSQDKTLLCNVKEVWVNKSNSLRGAAFPRIDGDLGWILGRFSSLQDALEELANISRWIEAGGVGVYQISQQK